MENCGVIKLSSNTWAVILNLWDQVIKPHRCQFLYNHRSKSYNLVSLCMDLSYFDGVCHNCETVLFLAEVNKYDWGRGKHFRAPRAFLFTRSSKFIYKILFALCLREHFFCCARLFTKIKSWITLCHLVQCICEFSFANFRV